MGASAEAGGSAQALAMLTKIKSDFEYSGGSSVDGGAMSEKEVEEMEKHGNVR